LDEGPLFIGNPVHHYEQLESTNSSALELLSKSNPSEGTAIMASFQTQGKGQYGREWTSAKGKNILCSIILYPNFLSIHKSFFLNIFAALAVRNTVADLIKANVSIKWPNDIYINDKKVAGILIQNTLQNHSIKNSIIGLGININQIAFNKSLPNPTSLALESDRSYNLNKLSQNLFRQIESYYLMLKAKKFSDMRIEYNQFLYRKNISTVFDLNGIETEGKLTEIDDSGKLIIQYDGTSKAFDLSEVKYLV